MNTQSAWNHYICDDCYKKLAHGETPYRVIKQLRHTAPCCACGKSHSSGIYYQANPEELPCKGLHELK